MKPVTTIAELEEVRGAERAFVFLFVNWSVHALHSRRLVQKVVDTWTTKAPNRSAPCYSIDLSEQEGETWDAVAGWLRAHGRPAERLMLSGSGPLLWLARGSVVAHVPAPLSLSAEVLLAVTPAIFGSDKAGGGPTQLDGNLLGRNAPIWPDDELTRQCLEGIAEARRRVDETPMPWEQAE
jgi:hypothetical protein